MYYQQLNSVRTIAVFMVIVFHWVPNSHSFILPLGSWGVEMFFVLSGFLITKILLESRRDAEINFVSKGVVIRNFILRRSLRIFPIYYLSLFAILFFDRANVSGLKDNLLYFFGYASNFLYFNTQNFNYPMAHFWSLAVEEQFYLIWPWFILFLPWRFVKLYLFISILFGIASRVVLSKLFFTNEVTVEVLTPTCFDCFSIGGLFSYFVFIKNGEVNQLIKKINIAGIVSFLVMLIFLWTKFNRFSELHRTVDSIFFLAIIANAYKGYIGWVGKMANNKQMIFLGQISYGLYIYHLITPWLTKVFFAVALKLKYNLVFKIVDTYNNAALIPKFSIDLIVLILVSTLSWHYVEKPINRYKHLFK